MNEQAGRSGRRIEAVIFDMDGVLIDSEPLWREVEVDVFGALGLSLTREMLEETMGRRTTEVVAHWFERHPDLDGDRAEVADRLRAEMGAAVRARGAAAPGAVAAIDRFTRAGLRLAVASSSSRAFIEVTLRTCGLLDRFEVLRSAEDEIRGKPHPDVYLAAARQLGVDPVRCLAIEDSPAGVRAAKAARMVSVAVPEPGLAEAVREAGADLVLGSLAELDDNMWRRLGAAPVGSST